MEGCIVTCTCAGRIDLRNLEPLKGGRKATSYDEKRVEMQLARSLKPSITAGVHHPVCEAHSRRDWYSLTQRKIGILSFRERWVLSYSERDSYSHFGWHRDQWVTTQRVGSTPLTHGGDSVSITAGVHHPAFEAHLYVSST